MSDHIRDNDLMEGQVVELTEAEQAQHQLQMEQQLKSFWAKQLLEVRRVRCVRRCVLCVCATDGDLMHSNAADALRLCPIMTDDGVVSNESRRWNSWKWAVNKVSRVARWCYGRVCLCCAYLTQRRSLGWMVDFKNHNDLPLARIKRIMKSDEDVRMISAEAPVLFAKACEMFILELTLRSWGYSEKNKRRTLQKEDIQTAIRNTDIFDFLVDVIN